MRNRLILWASLLMIAPCLSDSIAQAQTQSRNDQLGNRPSITADRVRSFDLLALARPNRRAGFALMPSRSTTNVHGAAFNISPMAGPTLPVLGSGTVGRLPKWTGITSSNSFISDSTIFESKLGLVGIGTDTPTSRLTVAGTIQSLTGGFQFPDGTVQTTAGIAPNQVVRSLNGLMGDLTLVPGANVTITPGSDSLTIAATGLLSGVSHDATLMGDGTIGSPLGVAVPLILTGSLGFGGVILATNTAEFGKGVEANGGPGGDGVVANGGSRESGDGGFGVVAFGGLTGSGFGGRAVVAFGGQAFGAGNKGGIGVDAAGGPGSDGATDGLAGRFNGDVEITGKLQVTSGMKMFHIDHPLDPEHKYLNHVAIESSEVLNVYSGNVTTDANGAATVTLPDWFEALNRDFRYQLTVVGQFAQAIVAEEIKGNRFTIKTDTPNVKVSWQVAGVRSDPTAQKFKFDVEEKKADRERGFYLHPEAFNQPEERGVEWARHPELMRQRKVRREEAKKQRTSNNR